MEPPTVFLKGYGGRTKESWKPLEDSRLSKPLEKTVCPEPLVLHVIREICQMSDMESCDQADKTGMSVSGQDWLATKNYNVF